MGERNFSAFIENAGMALSNLTAVQNACFSDKNNGLRSVWTCGQQPEVARYVSMAVWELNV